MDLSSQFTPDLTPPQLDKEYDVSPTSKQTRLHLIHKLAWFPQLLEQYLTEEEHQKEINLKTTGGWTVLHIACRNGLLDSVKILLQYDITDVNLSTNSEWVPLAFASKYSYKEIIILLINHPNINVNYRPTYGWTVLNILCWYSNDIECLELLLQHPKINVNLATRLGASAITLAFRNKNYNFVDRLLQVENINLPNDPELLSYAYNYKCQQNKELTSRLNELKRVKELDIGSLLFTNCKQYF